jgi:tetratricopeptide (TPR) repeat protein
MKLLTLAACFASLGFGQSPACDSLENCREALKLNPRYAEAHFRIGEIYLSEGNAGDQDAYRRAMNEFRMSIASSLTPIWIVGWAHINMGKIWDVLHNRDRALNEYRLALRTKDNTNGALDAATKYSEVPYSPN